MIQWAAALALGALLMAALSDVRTAKIPNSACVVVAAVGLALAADDGWAAALAAAGLMLAVLCVGIWLFARNLLGAGDAKLLAAVAALVGPAGFPLALAVMALSGGVLALAIAAHRGVLLPVVLDSGAMLTRWLRPSSVRNAPISTTGLTMPYGVAIAAGGVVAWLAA